MKITRVTKQRMRETVIADEPLTNLGGRSTVFADGEPTDSVIRFTLGSLSDRDDEPAHYHRLTMNVAEATFLRDRLTAILART